MDTNIEISNINKHFNINAKKKLENNENDENGSDNEYEENTKYETKIVDYNVYSINEINISNKIKTISYYSNYYSILQDYNFINISELNENYIEKLNIPSDKRYLIFKYKKGNYTTFSDYFLKFTTPKLFILNTIETFLHILSSLIKLHEHNICFFNLSPKNIVFNLDYGEKPILHNFQLSLQFSKLNEEYITNIIKMPNDYTYKPLEVHILFYLINNDISTISYSFIEEICEVFTNNLTILELYSLQFKESYKGLCIESLKKYINMSKTEIIGDIIKNADKWDVYSLSMLYIDIFANISRVFSLKQTFINKFTLELTKNINPDSLKRCSLEKLLENYNSLFISEKNNWTFVNNMEITKIEQLFKVLNITENS
jgi:hypothetical protein